MYPAKEKQILRTKNIQVTIKEDFHTNTYREYRFINVETFAQSDKSFYVRLTRLIDLL